MPLKYLIQTKRDFEDVIEYARNEDIFGIDTETNGQISRFKLSLVGISLGFDDFACYIPLTHLSGKQLPLEYVISSIKPLLEDSSTQYVCHNTKFDETVFKVYGVDCRGSGDDTFVLNWLLKEDAARGTRGLKPLVAEHLGIKMETYEDVVYKGRKRGTSPDYNFARVTLEDALSYAADDAYYTLKLYRLFEQRVREEGIWDAYHNIERPLLKIVRDMEWRGIGVDQDKVDEANTKYPEVMKRLEGEILAEVGYPFNIDSGPQLGKALFEDLKIHSNPPLTPTGKYKTDKKTLDRYSKHEIVKKVLRRKKVKKTYDVFVEGLAPHIQNDGRIHAQFNSSGTITGRFSSSKPNMQQIQGDEIEDIKVREFFVASSGYIFIVGDFSQIELRVMAHSARDEAAIAAFKSGRKFHDDTARKMFKLALDEEPTTRQKVSAKTINFGIPYGRMAMTIAEFLEISLKEAEDYITKWHEAFPRVEPFRQEFVKKARAAGFMRTISGRKRRLPDLRSHDFAARMSAERQCFNTLCQGSAADIIKLVMVQLAPKIEPYDAHILLQVHDELVLEVPKENAEKVVEILREVAENPLEGKNPLRVPLVFEPKIVTHWSDAK